MGKMATLGKMLDCFCVNPCRTSCFCTTTMEEEDEDLKVEQLPLIAVDDDHGGSKLQKRVKDVVLAENNQTLAFQLKPKMVVLKVSMHCNGCARKVEKHISKIDGVTKYKVDLESKMVMVIGDIMPLEVVQSVSKVKNAVLWTSPIP